MRRWPWLVAAALGTSGCLTGRVMESYQLGEAERLPAASLEAAASLGWVTEKLGDGRFRVLELPLQHRGPIEVTPGADGTLRFSGEAVKVEWDSRKSLGAVGPLLSQATLEVLVPAQRGLPLSRRSAALTVGLDLVAPAAAAAYLWAGNPYQEIHWGVLLGSRAMIDLAGALNLALGFELWRASGSIPLQALVGLEMLVINRVLGLLMDLPAVRFRNLASDAGFSLDGAQPPLRLPDLPGRQG